MGNERYTRRSLAQVVVEAVSPLAVGSGEKSITTDSEVALDINELPYIPGSTLKGVIRHALETSVIEGVNWETVFGYQEGRGGQGAQLIVSDGLLLDKMGKPIDEIREDDNADEFLKEYEAMPIRQHVRIGGRGAAEKGGKFDNQVAFAGSRFCFEIEQCMRPNDTDAMEYVLKALCAQSFRIGGGTRKGYGEIKVVSIKRKSIDLANPDQCKDYLGKSSSLASDWWSGVPNEASEYSGSPTDEDYDVYKVTLQPDDFFLFGSGAGDESGDADMAPVFEKTVDWSGKTACFTQKRVLVPASSVKGALAHRTAFHFNKKAGNWATEDNSDKLGASNEAVLHLFGGDKAGTLKRGNVLFSDVFGRCNPTPKLMNHVSIDRFTGGVIDGALFSEQTVYGQNKGVKDTFELNILVNKGGEVTADDLEAFEQALKDMVTGMLPLGGGVGRGNGFFSGSVIKNGKQI